MRVLFRIIKFSESDWRTAKQVKSNFSETSYLVDSSQPLTFSHLAFLYLLRNSCSMLSPREATQRAKRWRSTPSPTIACFVSSPWLVTAAFRAFRRFSAVKFLINKEKELTIVGILIEHFFHKSSRRCCAASDRFCSSILKELEFEL